MLGAVLLVAGAAGTSHDPAAPSEGYVYNPPPAPSPVAVTTLPPTVAVEGPSDATDVRGYLAAFPDGFSYVYAVQHPDAESTSRVAVSRALSSRAFSSFPADAYPAGYFPATAPAGFPANALPAAYLPAPSFLAPSFPATPLAATPLPATYLPAATFPAPAPEIAIPGAALQPAARLSPSLRFDFLSGSEIM